MTKNVKKEKSTKKKREDLNEKLSAQKAAQKCPCNDIRSTVSGYMCNVRVLNECASSFAFYAA
jgi:hypothetical protein